MQRRGEPSTSLPGDFAAVPQVRFLGRLCSPSSPCQGHQGQGSSQELSSGTQLRGCLLNGWPCMSWLWQGSEKGELVPHLWHQDMLITPSSEWPPHQFRATVPTAARSLIWLPVSSGQLNKLLSAAIISEAWDFLCKIITCCLCACSWAPSALQFCWTQDRSAGSSSSGLAGCRARLVTSLSEIWYCLGLLWYR